jgi:hypothetical protein
MVVSARGRTARRRQEAGEEGVAVGEDKRAATRGGDRASTASMTRLAVLMQTEGRERRWTRSYLNTPLVIKIKKYFQYFPLLIFQYYLVLVSQHV